MKVGRQQEFEFEDCKQPELNFAGDESGLEEYYESIKADLAKEAEEELWCAQ